MTRRFLNTTSLSTWLIAGALGAGMGMGVAGSAWAEDAAAPAAAPTTAAPAPDAAATPVKSDQTLGEVVVTAQKRAENVQDVPEAVQVVSGAQLQANAIRQFSDLTRAVPSLIVRTAEQPVNAAVSIRGIGTFAFSIGVEPSVAVQVDDVPVAFQARAFSDLNDISRIEVLRGPQSTLYGKSASAGLINIVTPNPTDTVTGRANVLATGDGEYQFGGAISGPITDQLAFRVSANFDDFGGNVHNVAENETVNGFENGSIYGKLQWTPTSRFTATLGLDYIDGDTTVGRPFIRVSPTADLRGNAAQPPAVWAPGVTFGVDNTDIDNNYLSGTNYDGFQQSLKLSYDLGGPNLLSITAHDRYTEHDRLDQDESALATPDNRQTGAFGSEEWSQELRLVSPSNQPLRYTAGIFYSSVDYSRDFTRGPFYSTARWDATAFSQQEAGFGQMDWEFLPGTTATGGLRYQRETIDYTFHDILGNAFYKGAATDYSLTYRLALEHKFTKNFMVYGSYATGHKGPTFDLSTGFNLNRELAGPVRPEKSGSWELGARTQFFDRRLTVNLTGFDAVYRDFQAQGIETLPDGTTNYRLANVGRIRTRGVELDSSARPIPELTLGASAAYLDATIEKFPFAQCYPNQTVAEGCVGNPAFQDLAGATPPQAPKWKLSTNFDYRHPLGSSPFEGVIQGAYSYTSSFNFSLSQDPQTIQKPYGILNLSIGVRNPEDHYEIMVFVNNALNDHYYADMYNSSSSYAGQTATQVLPPRDFDRYAGVRASYSF